jgi:hypothetical protein
MPVSRPALTVSPQPARPNFVHRNILPLSLAFLLVAALLTAFFWIEIFFPRAKPAIALARNTAFASPDVQASLGKPLGIGRFVHGRIWSKSDSANADLTLPIHGPRGHGQLIEWAQQDAGQWKTCSLLYRSGLTSSDLVLVSSSDTHCKPK